MVRMGYAMLQLRSRARVASLNSTAAPASSRIASTAPALLTTATEGLPATPRSAAPAPVAAALVPPVDATIGRATFSRRIFSSIPCPSTRFSHLVLCYQRGSFDLSSSHHRPPCLVSCGCDLAAQTLRLTGHPWISRRRGSSSSVFISYAIPAWSPRICTWFSLLPLRSEHAQQGREYGNGHPLQPGVPTAAPGRGAPQASAIRVNVFLAVKAAHPYFGSVFFPKRATALSSIIGYSGSPWPSFCRPWLRETSAFRANGLRCLNDVFWTERFSWRDYSCSGEIRTFGASSFAANSSGKNSRTTFTCGSRDNTHRHFCSNPRRKWYTLRAVSKNRGCGRDDNAWAAGLCTKSNSHGVISHNESTEGTSPVRVGEGLKSLILSLFGGLTCAAATLLLLQQTFGTQKYRSFWRDSAETAAATHNRQILWSSAAARETCRHSVTSNKFHLHKNEAAGTLPVTSGAEEPVLPAVTWLGRHDAELNASGSSWSASPQVIGSEPANPVKTQKVRAKEERRIPVSCNADTRESLSVRGRGVVTPLKVSSIPACQGRKQEDGPEQRECQKNKRGEPPSTEEASPTTKEGSRASEQHLPAVEAPYEEVHAEEACHHTGAGGLTPEDSVGASIARSEHRLASSKVNDSGPAYMYAQRNHTPAAAAAPQEEKCAPETCLTEVTTEADATPESPAGGEAERNIRGRDVRIPELPSHVYHGIDKPGVTVQRIGYWTAEDTAAIAALERLPPSESFAVYLWQRLWDDKRRLEKQATHSTTRAPSKRSECGTKCLDTAKRSIPERARASILLAHALTVGPQWAETVLETCPQPAALQYLVCDLVTELGDIPVTATAAEAKAPWMSWLFQPVASLFRRNAAVNPSHLQNPCPPAGGSVGQHVAALGACTEAARQAAAALDALALMLHSHIIGCPPLQTLAFLRYCNCPSASSSRRAEAENNSGWSNNTCRCAGGTALLRRCYAAAADYALRAASEEGAKTGWLRLLSSGWMDVFVQEVREGEKPPSREFSTLQKWIYGETLSLKHDAASQDVSTRWPHILEGISKDLPATIPASQEEAAAGLLQLLALTVSRCIFCCYATQQLPSKDFRQYNSRLTLEGLTLQQRPPSHKFQREPADGLILCQLAAVLGRLPLSIQRRQQGDRVGRVGWTLHAQKIWLDCTRAAAAQGSLMSSLTSSHYISPGAATCQRGRHPAVNASNNASGMTPLYSITEGSARKQNSNGGLEGAAGVLHGLCLEVQRLVLVWPVAAAACLTELLAAAACEQQRTRDHSPSDAEQLQDRLTVGSPSPEQETREEWETAQSCCSLCGTQECAHNHASAHDRSCEDATSAGSGVSSQDHRNHRHGRPATRSSSVDQLGKNRESISSDAMDGITVPPSLYIGKASPTQTLRLPLLPEVFLSLSTTLLDALHPAAVDAASSSEIRNSNYLWGVSLVPQAVLRLFSKTPAAAGEGKTIDTPALESVGPAVSSVLAPTASLPDPLSALNLARGSPGVTPATGLAAIRAYTKTRDEFQSRILPEESQLLLLVLASLIQGVVNSAGVITSPMHTAVLPPVAGTALETANKSSGSATSSSKDVREPPRSGRVAAGDNIRATHSSCDSYVEAAGAATRSTGPSRAAENWSTKTGAISSATAGAHQHNHPPTSVSTTIEKSTNEPQISHTKQRIAGKDPGLKNTSTSLSENSNLSARADINRSASGDSSRPTPTGSNRIAPATDIGGFPAADSSRSAPESGGGDSFIKKASDTARGSIGFGFSGSLTASDKAAAAAEKATASTITSATFQQASAWALYWLQYGRDLPKTGDQSHLTVTDDEPTGAIQPTGAAPNFGRMLVRLSLKVAELQQEKNVQKRLTDMGRHRLHESTELPLAQVHAYSSETMMNGSSLMSQCRPCDFPLSREACGPLRQAMTSWMAAQGVESPHFGIWLEELRFYTLQHMELQLLADLVERPARLAAAAFFDWDADVSLLETLALLSSSTSHNSSASSPTNSSSGSIGEEVSSSNRAVMSSPGKATTEGGWLIPRWFKGGVDPDSAAAFSATDISSVHTGRATSLASSEISGAPAPVLQSRTDAGCPEDKMATTVSVTADSDSAVPCTDAVTGAGEAAAIDSSAQVDAAATSFKRGVAEGFPVARRRADMEVTRQAAGVAVAGNSGREASRMTPVLENSAGTVPSIKAPANHQMTIELMPCISEEEEEGKVAGNAGTPLDTPASRTTAAASGEAAKLLAAVDTHAPTLETEATVPVPLVVREAAVKEVLENSERREALQQLALLTCCSRTFPMEQLWAAGGFDVLRLLAKKELDLLLRDPVALALYSRTGGGKRDGFLPGKRNSASTIEEGLASTARVPVQTEAALGWLQQVRQFQWIPDVGSFWRSNDKTRTTLDQKASREALFLAVENARKERELMWKEIHQISRIAANVSGAPESPMTCSRDCLEAWQKLMLQLVHEVYVHPALLSPLFVRLREEIPEVTLRLAAPSAVYYEAVRCLHNLTPSGPPTNDSGSRSAGRRRQLQRVNILERPTYLSCIYPFAVPGQPHHLVDPLLLLPPLHSPVSRIFRDFIRLIRSSAAVKNGSGVAGTDVYPSLGGSDVGHSLSNVAGPDSSSLTTRPKEADDSRPGDNYPAPVMPTSIQAPPPSLSGKYERPRSSVDDDSSWTETTPRRQMYVSLHRNTDERDPSQPQLLPYKPHLPTRHLTKRQLEMLLRALQLHQQKQLQEDVQDDAQLQEDALLEKDTPLLEDEHLQNDNLQQFRELPSALEPQHNEEQKEEDIAADSRRIEACIGLSPEDETDLSPEKTKRETHWDADADDNGDKYADPNLGQDNASIGEEKILGGEMNDFYEQNSRSGDSIGNVTRYFAHEQRQSSARGRNPTNDGEKSSDGPPFIIFLHGLRGSAWRTWRCSHCGNECVLPDPTASLGSNTFSESSNSRASKNDQRDIIRAEVIDTKPITTNKNPGILEAAYEKAALKTSSPEPVTSKKPTIETSALNMKQVAGNGASAMVSPRETALSSPSDLSFKPALAVVDATGTATAASVLREKAGGLPLRRATGTGTTTSGATETDIEFGHPTAAPPTETQPIFTIATPAEGQFPPCACHVLRDTAKQLQLEEKDYTGSTQSFYYLWPRQLLAQQFPQYCILSVDYQAPLFRRPVPFCRRPPASAPTLTALVHDEEKVPETSDISSRSEVLSPSVDETKKEKDTARRKIQHFTTVTAEKEMVPEEKVKTSAGTTPSRNTEDSKSAVFHMGLSLHPLRKVSVFPEQQEPYDANNMRWKNAIRDSEKGTSMEKSSKDLYKDNPSGSDADISAYRRYEGDCDTWVTAGGSAEEESPTLWQLGRCVQRQLRAAGVGQGNRPIVLVAHSMGGLIAEYLLLRDADIRRNTRAVLFFSTPHLGSPLAEREWLRLVTRSWLPLYVQQLSPVDATLRSFSSSFARLIHSPAGKHIRVAAIGELRPTPLPYIGRYAMVVPVWSSLPSWLPAQPALLVDVHHSHTCKPASSNDIRYTVLEELLFETLQGEGTIHTARRSSAMEQEQPAEKLYV